jgi:hypothetical protein
MTVGIIFMVYMKIPPSPPLPKGGMGGFSCFVVPVPSMGVILNACLCFHNDAFLYVNWVDHGPEGGQSHCQHNCTKYA